MVSDRVKAQNFLQIAVHGGSYLAAHPFTWNKDTRRMEITTSSIRIQIWKFNVLLTFLYYAFIVYQCIRITADENAPLSRKLYMQFAVVYYAPPALLQYCIFKTMLEMPDFVSHYFRFFEDFHSTCTTCRNGWAPKELRLCKLLLAFLYYGFNVNALLVTISAFFRPFSPELLSSVLVDPHRWYARIGVTIFQGYFIQTYLVNAHFMTFFTLYFFFNILAVLSELQAPGTPSQRELGTPENVLRLYEMMRLLLDESMRATGTVLQGAKLLLILFTIYCTYGGVRLHGIMALTMGFIGFNSTVMLAVSLETVGKIHAKSLDVLAGSKWKYCKCNLVIRKRFQALPVLKFYVGNLYYMDMGCVLTTSKIIFDQTTNLLLFS